MKTAVHKSHQLWHKRQHLRHHSAREKTVKSRFPPPAASLHFGGEKEEKLTDRHITNTPSDGAEETEKKQFRIKSLPRKGKSMLYRPSRTPPVNLDTGDERKKERNEAAARITPHSDVGG
jgi:hypothetical protein